MCRGCFFVQMDSDGIDVDGCWKAEIIEELGCEYGENLKVRAILDEEEKKLETETACFEGLKNSKLPEYCPLLTTERDFVIGRERAFRKWKSDLAKRIEEARKATDE